jgi:mannosyltransferase OCH1-like enzyme
MLSRSLQYSRILNYYSLIALCMIALIYHILSTQDRFTFRAPGAPAIAQQPQHNGIPKLLWYKLGPNGLSEETRTWTNSCIANNPEYKATFLTDESSDEYVRKTFQESRPDIVESYLSLPIPIYKADMLRYMLLWDQGGVWSDLDVSCEENITIDEWVPAEYREAAALVVGWEFDVGWPGLVGRQFNSWTFMAKPRLPHMIQVVDDIIQTLREKTTELQIPIQNITMEMMGDTVDVTGPRRLTRSVFTSLSRQLNRTVEETEIQEIVQPKLVGDVLVLPGRSLAASANLYAPEQEELLPPKLVTHHYAGTWKNDHGGEEVKTEP